MMRIAVWHNLPSGGGQRALYDHVKGLLGRGHEVEIFSPPTADRKLLDINSLATHHEVPLRPQRVGRRNVPPWLRSAIPEFSLSAMDEHCRAVGKKVNSGGFDLLFSGSCMQFNTPPLARYVDVPSVLYLQEPHRLLYEAPNIWGRPVPPLELRRMGPKSLGARALDLVEVENSRRQVRAERANAAAFGTILVNSLFSAESVTRVYDLSSRVCYLGVDPAIWQVERRSSDATTVVGIGTIAPHKKPDFVVDAVARAGLKDCRICWVGNDVNAPFAAELRRRAEALKVDLELRVAVSHPDMLELLAEASFLAYAPRLEPFGYAPLECGAAGVPTVAVAEGGMRETVIDGVTGLLVSRDAEEMGRAFRTLANDYQLRQSLGRKARKWVEDQWALEPAVGRLERELSRVARS
jgi:glycosyltransferase involved in cell wall biosynthesis